MIFLWLQLIPKYLRNVNHTQLLIETLNFAKIYLLYEKPSCTSLVVSRTWETRMQHANVWCVSSSCFNTSIAILLNICTPRILSWGHPSVSSCVVVVQENSVRSELGSVDFWAPSWPGVCASAAPLQKATDAYVAVSHYTLEVVEEKSGDVQRDKRQTTDTVLL